MTSKRPVVIFLLSFRVREKAMVTLRGSVLWIGLGFGKGRAVSMFLSYGPQGRLSSGYRYTPKKNSLGLKTKISEL